MFAPTRHRHYLAQVGPHRYRPAGRWSSSAVAEADETQAGLERRVHDGQWFREALGHLQTAQEILRIEDKDAASVVFTRAEVTSPGGRSTSS